VDRSELPHKGALAEEIVDLIEISHINWSSGERRGN
jgi:hypothetical protein